MYISHKDAAPWNSCLPRSAAAQDIQGAKFRGLRWLNPKRPWFGWFPASKAAGGKVVLFTNMLQNLESQHNESSFFDMPPPTTCGGGRNQRITNAAWQRGPKFGPGPSWACTGPKINPPTAYPTCMIHLSPDVHRGVP